MRCWFNVAVLQWCISGALAGYSECSTAASVENDGVQLLQQRTSGREIGRTAGREVDRFDAQFEAACAGHTKTLIGQDIEGLLGHVRGGLAMEGSDQQTRFIPFVSNVPLDRVTSRSKMVNKVVIIAQPYSPFAMQAPQIFSSFCQFLNPYVYNQGAATSTLVIAPWFLEDSTSLAAKDWLTKSEQESSSLPAGATALWWSSAGAYTVGKDSMIGEISSFAVLDRFVTFLQEDIAGAFPALKSISVIGFSGGGKLVSRWAVLSDVLLPGGRARVQALPAAANTYMYLDSFRPSSECTPMSSEKTASACSNFTIPVDAQSECPKYNHYPYGLGHVAKTGYSYLHAIASDPVRLRRTLASLPNKSIMFAVGSWDNCNCNDDDRATGFVNAAYCFMPPPDCADSFPDDGLWAVNASAVGGSCQKKYLGWTRLARFNNYMSYLSSFYEREFGVAYAPEKSTFVGGHDLLGFWSMPAFNERIFGWEPDVGSGMA